MTQMMQNILSLSISERILMVEAIWDSIEMEEEKVDLSPELIDLLDQRLDQHHNTKEEGSSWEDVKKRLKDQF